MLAGSASDLKGNRVSPLDCQRQLLEQVDVSLALPVMVVICIPISHVSSTAWSCHVPAVSMATG